MSTEKKKNESVNDNTSAFEAACAATAKERAELFPADLPPSTSTCSPP